MNKKGTGLTIFLICMCSILAIAILVFLIVFLTSKSNFTKFSFNIPSNKISKNIVFDEKYDDVLGNVNLTLEIGELEINNSTSKEISVKIYADEDYIKEYNVENKEDLNIDLKGKSCKGFCFNNVTPRVVITLPSDFDKTIAITSDYGDVKVESFENASIIANLSAGNIEIDKISSASINEDAGNVKINEAKDLIIKEKAGNVEINKVDSVAISNDYGNIDIEEVNEYMDLYSDCGNIKVKNAKITKNSKIKCDLGNIKINNISNVYIDAKNKLGDLKISGNDRKSDIILKIENKCGDIKVNQ